MNCRDVYLRIEKVPAYSPVAPENGEHDRHGRDCMRNHGHENARIPRAEVERAWTPSRVVSVVLIWPSSVTHHTDAGHRRIRIPIEASGASSIDVRMPADGAVAPPGHYLLFLLDDQGVPSVGRFLQVG